MFVIPESVNRKAKNKKIALVLDMDETLVYTRRSGVPDHSNYITTEVLGFRFSLRDSRCMLNLVL